MNNRLYKIYVWKLSSQSINKEYSIQNIESLGVAVKCSVDYLSALVGTLLRICSLLHKAWSILYILPWSKTARENRRKVGGFFHIFTITFRKYTFYFSLE